MYSFAELCPESSSDSTSFCYMLGVLKKMPPKQALNAKTLTDEFGWLYSGEDQCQSVWSLKRRSVLNKYVIPSAPLTLAPTWTPFPLAFQVLPEVMVHGSEAGSNSSAFAIFKPRLAISSDLNLTVWDKVVSSISMKVEDKDLNLENIHAHHFFWLLKMTVARAIQMKGSIFLAGTHGFGYQSLLEDDVSADSKLLKLKAGYLYPDRVPQGARFAYLTDPAARTKHAELKANVTSFSAELPPLRI